MRKKEIKGFYKSYDDRIKDKRYQSVYPLRRFIHQSRLDCLLSHLAKDKKILEIGAGDGVFAVEAAKKGFSIVATDISEPNLKQARQLALEESRGSSVEFIQADAEKLPFEDNSFDIVVASHVLEHLPDFNKGLREVYRVTKGKAIIALPTILNPCSMIICGNGHWWYFSKRGLPSLLIGFIRTIKSLIFFDKGVEQGFYGKKDMPHLWRFPWVMKRELESVGFRIVSFEPDSLALPFFNFLLPLVKFMDRNRSFPIFRYFGYGSHAVLVKSGSVENNE